MRALSAHPYGCGCVEGLSCKMRVPRHPRASTALAPAQLSPTSLWRSVRSSSLFSEGEGVITQTVTWVASGAPAKGRTSFWQGPTALWDEEHARQSHQASECAGGEFEIPAPRQLLHYPQVQNPGLSLHCVQTPPQQLPRHLHTGNPEQQPVVTT